MSPNWLKKHTEMATVSLVEQRDNYIKYDIYTQRKSMYTQEDCQVLEGSILFEKYGDQYHLELMSVLHPGQGIGTCALQKVLKEQNMDPSTISVHPISPKSKKFFSRFGFKME